MSLSSSVNVHEPIPGVIATNNLGFLTALRALKIDTEHVYMNDKHLKFLSSHIQLFTHTSAGFIAFMLVLIYNRHELSPIDYQTSHTKHVSFATFQHVFYNSSRHFTCITKDTTNHSTFINIMQNLCKKQIIYGIEIISLAFKHCFLVVGQIRNCFVILTRYHENSELSWALLEHTTITNNDITLLFVHDMSAFPVKTCPRARHLEHGSYIYDHAPLYERSVYKYT